MKMFGRLTDPACVGKIREYIEGLPEEVFVPLDEATVSCWATSMRRDGRPSREELKNFESILLSTTPGLLEGYDKNEEHDLLTYLFAATNDRYLASKS